MGNEDISFDDELGRGVVSYNDKVGRWWDTQSVNAAHRYAYRTIADFVRETYAGSPQLIVDFACGHGNLLTRLARRFPESRLMGLDGSSYMLGLAHRRIARMGVSVRERIELVETLLPDPQGRTGIADVVVFAFPNIVPGVGVDDRTANEKLLSRLDREAARALAAAPDPEADGDCDDFDEVYSNLLRERLVALNLRRLLKPGGICYRVEYSAAPREELSRLELLRTEFEEGAMEQDFDGLRSERWFRILASSYYRSGVMEDVYHQSQDEDHRQGGYFITVLRAI